MEIDFWDRIKFLACGISLLTLLLRWDEQEEVIQFNLQAATFYWSIWDADGNSFVKKLAMSAIELKLFEKKHALSF